MGLQNKTLWVLIFLSLFLVACNDTTVTNEKKEVGTPTTPANTVAKNDHEGHAHGESASVDEPVKASDYDVFDKPIATDNSEQVVIYEFFGYTCPHCFTFQPYMEKWLENKPDYVKLVRIPLNFQPNWEVLQKAYFTAEIMGIAEKSHQKLFSAIHNDNKRFHSIEDLAQWYADEININKEEFLSTAESFILDSKQRKADNMGFKMQITSTPTVIVNGKLRASKHVHDREKLMQVLDFLVEKEAKEMGLITE